MLTSLILVKSDIATKYDCIGKSHAIVEEKALMGVFEVSGHFGYLILLDVQFGLPNTHNWIRRMSAV